MRFPQIRSHTNHPSLRFRGYFRRDRALLRELPRLAWETVREVYGEYAGPTAVPGMITFLQTFGELVNWHPHVHALVTDGVFQPNPTADNDTPAGGTFLSLPGCPTGAFLLLWRERIFALLVERGYITRCVVHIMRSWKHSGSCHLDSGMLRFPHMRITVRESQPRVLKMDENMPNLTPTASRIENNAGHLQAGWLARANALILARVSPRIPPARPNP